MLVEEEFDEILKTVKRLVAMKKSPCLLEQILLEYMQLKGKRIPFKKFGYVNEYELFLERDGRGAGNLFTLKDRKGKLYIELRKTHAIEPITSIKSKIIKNKQQLTPQNAASLTTAPTIKLRKIKSSSYLNQEDKKSDKNLNSITKRKTLSSTNTTTIKSIDKLNLKNSIDGKRSQQSAQKTRDNKLKTSAASTLNHSFKSISETKMKKAMKKQKITNSNSSISNKTKQEEYQNDDNDFTESTALTQVKSLPQYYHTHSENTNGPIKAELNFLDWHLINILHTKVMAHPNGFYAHELPVWYQRTFDRHIDENWFDLINKSNEFIQEKEDDNKILLFVKNDLDIDNIIKTTKAVSLNEGIKDDEDEEKWF